MHSNLCMPADRVDHIELWFATPAAEDFFDPAVLSRADQDRFKSPRSSRRQQEFKVSRALKAFSAAEQEGRRFSLSHSASHAALALGPDSLRLGVDLEMARDRDVIKIARNVFHESELQLLLQAKEDQRLDLFYTVWTLKESFIKALGFNLFDGLNHCVFGPPSSGGIEWSGEVPLPPNVPWSARVYRPRTDFYLAIVSIGQQRTVKIFEWPPKKTATWPVIASVARVAHLA